VNINSNRSEVDDDVTKFFVNFSDYNKGIKYDFAIDFGDKERTWISVVLPIKQMIKDSKFSENQWPSLKHLQLSLSESDYKNGTNITFNFSDLAFLKFNRPIIQEIESSPFVILPKTDYLLKIKGFGFPDHKKQGVVINASILDEEGQIILSQKKSLTKNPFFIMHLDSLNVGKYKLKLSIVENRNTFFSSENILLSEQTKTIEVVSGFIE
jgi:hypothetical protein